MSAPEQPRRTWASPAQLAEWLQLDGDALRKLKRMRTAGTGPKFVRVGREVRYAWSDVHAWCRVQRDRPTSLVVDDQ